MGHERRARWTGTAATLVTALLAIAPLLVRGTTCGHDFDFHLANWLDVHQSWTQGILYPHWAAHANWGAGEPRFIFYPPLEWMLGAALGFVLPWGLVEPAVVFLCLAGCGLATRALAREKLTEGAATLAGCVALFSGYGLFTAYERSDFAELMGGFWIPLVLLFALRDRRPEAGAWRRALDGSAALLALTVAGAWLSNAPLGVMTSYLLVAAAATAAVTRRSWAPVMRAGTAAAIALALVGVWLAPAAVEQRWVDVRQILDDPGSRVEANWLFAHHADPAMAPHDAELLRVSWIAVGMLTVALAGLLLAWRRGRLRSDWGWWLPVAVIPVAVLLMLLPVSGWVWSALPKLRFLQFPWRWLVVLQAPMGVLLAAGAWAENRRVRAAVSTLCAAGCVALAVMAGLMYFQSCYPEDSVPAMVDAWHNGEGWEGTYEYEPPGADDSALAMDLPDACLVDDAKKTLGHVNDDQALQWTPDEKSCIATFDHAKESRNERFVLDADAPRAGFLVVKLRSYPAWAVRVNGALQTQLAEREDGLIVVPVAAGRVRVTVDWTTTRDAWAGRGLSLLGLLLLTGVCALEFGGKRARVEL
ncbi:MAG: hypothetical protein P4L40_05555 [Terracidiphilus sp.]|nr:hypothetical protein [Terracidiphilus sp.]